MVGQLTEIVTLECGVHPAVAKQVRVAATLHDVGKQKIPVSILNKPGKLDAREFEIIKTHTVLGAEALTSVKGELGEMARACCLFHHEWWNGFGYCGRKTDELPFYVAAVAISDVFVALVCERPYKTAWPPQEALDYIQNQAGTQFSPALVEMFIALILNDNRVPALFADVRA